MIKIDDIQTERLNLTALCFSHSKGIFDLWSHKDVCLYSGIVKDYDNNIIPTPVTSESDSDRIIDFWIKAAQDGWGFRWATIFQNKCVGTIGFNSVKENYEIAFHLHPSYWGKGIMREAAEAAIKWAKHNRAKAITAFIDPQNTGSVSLAKRLGLASTEIFEDGAQLFKRKL